MRRMLHWYGVAVLMTVLAAAVSPASAGPQVPRVVKFAGVLDGVRGPTILVFSLYPDQAASAPLWQEVQSVIVDEQGRYAVHLGATLPGGLPPEMFAAGDARWLGVRVEGQPELARVALVSVPYAMKAADAETVGGRPLSAFVLAGETTGVGPDGLTYVDTRVLKRGLAAAGPLAQGAGNAGYIGVFTDTTNLGNSVMFQSGSSIGVGTTTPAAAFHAVASSAPGAFFDVYSNALGALPLVYRAARGTPASPSAVQADDILGGLAVRGYGATGFTTGRGQVMFKAAENWTDAANGTYLSMTTTPAGSTGWVERLRINSNGYVGLGTSAPEFPIDARLNRGSTFARFGASTQPLFLMGGNPQVGFNLYSDSGYRYGATWYGGYLAFDTDVSGGFSFGTAPVGSIGTLAATQPRVVITNDGNVGIGKLSPTARLDVGGSLSAGPGAFLDSTTNGTGVEGRANIGTSGWGVYGLAAEGVGVMGRSTSATGYGGRFENLGSGKALGAMVGSTEVMTADLTGVHAGPGMTPTPIAHGFFDATAGARLSGSSNITCAWDAGFVRYACTIAGENYSYWAYTVSVTPTSLAVPVTSSMSNQLIVFFYNLAGTAVKPATGFSVVVFKQ